MSDPAVSRCLGRNPYVGPRPFRQDEAFYGREREIRGLSDTLISSRIVLLHSPSGAGKTSLIQAAIVPYFHEHGYAINAGDYPAREFTALRVNEPPPDFAVRNRYVYSVVISLAGHLAPCADLADVTLADAMTMTAHERRYRLFVLDQLEEVLALDQTDRHGREEFFRQLGEALEDDYRWCLLSMREDYLGGLDPYLRLFPGRLRATYRLGALDRGPALRAITSPARGCGATITDGAAARIFDDLRTISVQGPDREPLPQRGLYVEPVLLQVVCHRLWRMMCRDSRGDFDTVDVADVELLGSTDDAIGRYYADVLDDVSGGDRWTERAIRSWIGTHLITKDGYRSQTRIGPPVTDSAEVLRKLQSLYLIRSEDRAGTKWWELCHDRLVEPIRRDNTRRTASLHAWQRSALKWHADGERDADLLTADDAADAQFWLSRHAEHATALERRYVDRSVDQQRLRVTFQRFTRQARLLAVVLGASLLLNLVLLTYLAVR
jgi:hypothetical protein